MKQSLLKFLDDLGGWLVLAFFASVFWVIWDPGNRLPWQVAATLLVSVLFCAFALSNEPDADDE